MIDKAKVFRELYRQSCERDFYLDKVPVDLYSSVIDNGYVNSIVEERDMLLKLVFGDHTESVEWFLYEWQPGYEVSINGQATAIHSIDQYIQWMKDNEGF